MFWNRNFFRSRNPSRKCDAKKTWGECVNSVHEKCRILRWNARCSVQHQGWFPRISRWNSHQSLFVERISDSYWEWDPDPSSMVAAAWMRRAVVCCRPCKGALDSKGTDVTNMKQDMLGRLRYQNVGEDCFLIFLRFAMAHFQFKKYWRTVSISNTNAWTFTAS